MLVQNLSIGCEAIGTGVRTQPKPHVQTQETYKTRRLHDTQVGIKVAMQGSNQLENNANAI